jgi:hypothetical protein
VRNYLFTIIFLGLASYLGFQLYERYSDFDWRSLGDKFRITTPSSEEPQLGFPDEIKIVRQDGRALQIRLLSRNADYIQFERLSDGQAFTYAIDQLNAKSKQRIYQYPDTGLSDAGKLLQSGILTLEDAHVEQIRERIKRIDVELQNIESKYLEAESKVEARTLQRKVEDLVAQRRDLQDEINARFGN